MRIVLDSNVLLGAFATSGVCQDLYQICLAQHELVLSEFILLEVRKHMPRVIRGSEEQSEAIVDSIRRNADIIDPADVPVGACRDPNDLPVLGTALAAQADFLITGDADLLELGDFQGIPIISPRGFYERFR